MKDAHIFVQDESKNKFGTYKDRRSKHIVDLAAKNNIRTLSLITSGNAGYSLAQYARPFCIRVVSIVDKKIKPHIRQKLEEVCYKVQEYDLEHMILESENIIKLAGEGEQEMIWDVTNGYSSAYLPLVYDIREKKKMS